MRAAPRGGGGGSGEGGGGGGLEPRRGGWWAGEGGGGSGRGADGEERRGRSGGVQGDVEAAGANPDWGAETSGRNSGRGDPRAASADPAPGQLTSVPGRITPLQTARHCGSREPGKGGGVGGHGSRNRYWEGKWDAAAPGWVGPGWSNPRPAWELGSAGWCPGLTRDCSSPLRTLSLKGILTDPLEP